MEMNPAIFGLEALDLPEGYTPLEAVTVLKALDEEGRVSLCLRSTDGLNAWESLGMLDAAADVTRRDLTACFADEEADDEDEE